MVIYDDDTDRIYSFTDWQQVLRSVRGSMETYMEELDDAQAMINYVMANIENWDHRTHIPIKANNLVINIYGWQLDRSNNVHRTLSKCFEEVGNDLKLEIMTLFTNER